MIYEYILVPGSTISWFSLLGICIGIINIFLPMETINKALFKVRLCPPLKETYNDNISNFQFVRPTSFLFPLSLKSHASLHYSFLAMYMNRTTIEPTPPPTISQDRSTSIRKSIAYTRVPDRKSEFSSYCSLAT